MRLLLFDVDGTLLRANGGGKTAIEQAVSTVTGQTVSTDDVTFSGRTDPAIFRDVLLSNGLPVGEEVVDRVIRAYVDLARETIHPANVDRLPATDALLSLLAQRSDVFLGLVTGNVESIAYHKLQTVGFAQYFSVGAFGSDHVDRSKLPPLAADRAAETAARPFPLSHTIVLGDTSRDVNCARSTGAHAVAVCTGRPDRSDLASAAPDLLLDDFSNPAAIVKEIVNL